MWCKLRYSLWNTNYSYNIVTLKCARNKIINTIKTFFVKKGKKLIQVTKRFTIYLRTHSQHKYSSGWGMYACVSHIKRRRMCLPHQQITGNCSRTENVRDVACTWEYGSMSWLLHCWHFLSISSADIIATHIIRSAFCIEIVWMKTTWMIQEHENVTF